MMESEEMFKAMGFEAVTSNKEMIQYYNEETGRTIIIIPEEKEAMVFNRFLRVKLPTREEQKAIDRKRKEMSSV